MSLVTNRFYDFVFPRKKDIMFTPKVNYNSNNVIFKNLIIYGFQGSGKTSIVNSIVKYAIKKYGQNNVNAVMSEHGELGTLLHFGLRPTMVNILFADNLTLRPLDRKELQEYFRVRHIFQERFKLNNGYILSILSLHRFHSIPVELRTTMNGIIIKDSTMNPYDRAILVKLAGPDLIRILDEMNNKESLPYLKEYAVFVCQNFKGIIKIPLCKEMYLNEINVLELLKRGEI